MKTGIFTSLKSVVAMGLLVLMSACGAKDPTAESVAQKINEGGKLTEADYSAMIDYCGKYASEAQNFYDTINAQPNDSTPQAESATSGLAALYEKYSYLDQFRTVLAQTDMSALGEKNEKKVQEFAKYQGFPLPIGEGADLRDPQVVGMIEDMPDSDTAGVIADGDGEAVDVNVK